jgi:glc operon protein GlcG
MRTRKVLTLDDARRIAAAAEAEAVKNGWNVVIAVCDEGGHLMWLQRLDGAQLMSIEVAPEKARAAVHARRPTKLLEDMVNGGRLAGLHLPVQCIEGGEMIVADGELLGAIGVSGVKPHEDAQIARAGIAAIGASCTL